MTACPATDQLQAFLDDRLPALESDRVEAHLETCAACQRLLEEWTGDEPRSGQTTSRNDSGAEFLEELKDNFLPQPTGPRKPKELPPMPEAPPGYELLGVLGRGGMGVVYRTRQVRLDRVVALKMILAGAHADSAEVLRFLREAEAIARLQHPCVVQVFEIGEHQGLPYICLEYCPGGSLHGRLLGTPQPPQEAARLLEPIARGVHAAHAVGVIHRDLKPHNILFAADGTPRIADFGLARRMAMESDEVAPGLTTTGAILGTPAYMAPEQASGQGQVSPRIDVYALGVILYEMLTGRPPIQAATAVETVLRVLSDEPAPVRLLQPRVPRDLETVCHKCLRKEPSQRYASAAELADDLGRFLAGEPVRARPVGLLGRAARWARRRPAIAGLLLLLVFLTAVGVGAFAWAYSTALHERGLAQAEADLNRRRAANATLLLAQAAWRNRQYTRARELLEDVPADLRHWEWFYLERAYSGGIFTLVGHTGPVTAVRFSEDGATLVTASRDGTLRVWDARTGREQTWIACGERPTQELACSPNAGTLFTHDEGGTLQIWDTRRGTLLASRSVSEKKPLHVAFSPDGQRVAAWLPTGLRIWHTRTGKELLAIPPQRNLLAGVCFSPDGRRVAVGGLAAKVWDAETGNELLSLHEAVEPTRAVCFSPDGQRLVTFSERANAVSKVRFWDVDSGNRLLELDVPSGQGWGNACFSPNGEQIAFAEWYRKGHGVVQVWDARTGKPLRTLAGHTDPVAALCFSPDGQRLVTASEDGTAKVWDIRSDPDVLTLEGQPRTATCAWFSPDGRSVVTNDANNSESSWDAHTARHLLPGPPQPSQPRRVGFSADGNRVAVLGSGHKFTLRDLRTEETLLSAKDITAASLSPDGLRVALAREEGIEVWDVEANRVFLTLQAVPRNVYEIKFSPDGQSLAGSPLPDGDVPGPVLLWDANTGKRLRSFPWYSGTAHRIAFSPDGRYLIAGGGDGTNPGEVRVWEPSTGKEVLELRGHTAAVHAVAFSADGRRIVTGSRDQTARVWDVQTGIELLTLGGHPDTVGDVALSPEGRLLATATQQAKLKLWNAGPRPQLRFLRGHTSQVNELCFSPDGTLLATTSMDRTARLWDVRSSRELHCLRGHTRPVFGPSFSPDGRRLLTSAWDRTAKVWEVSSGKLLLSLPPADELLQFTGFGEDGQRLLTRTKNAIHIWDADTGKLLEDVEPIPVFAPRTPCSPDGSLIAFTRGNTVLLRRVLEADEEPVCRARTRLEVDWHTAEASAHVLAARPFAAAFHLEQLLAARPDDAGARGRLVQMLEQLVKQQPESAPLWRRLALAQLHGGQREAFQQTCLEMQQRFPPEGKPDGNRLLTVRTSMLSAGVLQAPESWLPHVPEEDKLLRGAVLQRAGKHAEALKELTALTDVRALAFRALAEHATENGKAAQQTLEQALGLMPAIPCDVITSTPQPWQTFVEMRLLTQEAAKRIRRQE